MKNLTLMMLVLMGSTQAFAVECKDLQLEGKYNIRLIPEKRDLGLIEIRKLPYLENAYSVSGEIEKLEGYNMMALTTRNIPSEGEDTCAIAWFNPTKVDFEFNLILQSKASGSLLLGGDFETTDLLYFTKLQ